MISTSRIHETEIKPPGSKWSGPGPPEGRNRVEIGLDFYYKIQIKITPSILMLQKYNTYH